MSTIAGGAAAGCSAAGASTPARKVSMKKTVSTRGRTSNAEDAKYDVTRR
jgi:hypothetical protein